MPRQSQSVSQSLRSCLLQCTNTFHLAGVSVAFVPVGLHVSECLLAGNRGTGLPATTIAFSPASRLLSVIRYATIPLLTLSTCTYGDRWLGIWNSPGPGIITRLVEVVFHRILVTSDLTMYLTNYTCLLIRSISLTHDSQQINDMSTHLPLYFAPTGIP